MKRNFKKTVILAGIGAALAIQGANAQIVPAAANGDLIFGAEVLNAAGVAQGNNLEVDLGSISKFTTTAQLTFANVSATDLAAVLGSGFASSSNAFFSVAGTTNLSDVDGYFNRATFATLLQDPGALSKTQLTTASNLISGLYSGLNQSVGFAAAPNSNGAGGILSATGNTQSYSSEEGTAAGGTTFFNFVGGGSASFGSGLTLDLYALNSAGDSNGVRNTVGTDTLLGTFSYSADKGLTFTGAAVPEPSTVGLTLVGLAAAAFAFKRRHSFNS